MSKDNGGPAFPFGQTDSESGQLVNGWGSEGMTLRDYFAAKALNGMLDDCRWGTLEDSAEMAARVAYKLADAMLAERAK